MRKLLIVTLMCALVFGVTSTAKAVVLVPGAMPVVSTAAAVPSGVFLTQTVSKFTGKDVYNETWFTGTLTQKVYKNGTGVLFTYQFSNNSSSKDYILTLSTTNFAGFLADADVTATGWEMQRSHSGTTLTFDYDAGIMNGTTSPLLWVQTDAGWFRTGGTNLEDGGNARVATYAPIPEPTSMLLLGMGILGVFGLRKKLKA